MEAGVVASAGWSTSSLTLGGAFAGVSVPVGAEFCTLGCGTSDRGVGAAADTDRGGKTLTPVLGELEVMADDVCVLDNASTKKGGVCVPVLIVLRRATAVILAMRKTVDKNVCLSLSR